MSYYLRLVGLHKLVLSVGLIKLLMDSLVVWGPSLYQQYLQRLQRFQNHAVHLIFSLNKFDHVSEHYKRLQWLDLDQLIWLCLVCVMFHQYHSSQGISLRLPIQFGNRTSYYTRTQPHFNCCRLSQTQKFFRCAATNYWNDLPSHLKQMTYFSGFSRAAKHDLLNS